MLVSIGRRPNSEIPGLDGHEGEGRRAGFIKVDDRRRTAEPTIYAIGDVAGEPMLAHKASHEARVAVEAIAGEQVVFEPRRFPPSSSPIPSWRGAASPRPRPRSRSARWRSPVPRGAASGRALTLDRSDGVTKLVLDPQSGRVLGVGLVGPGAGELISEGVLAVEMGAPPRTSS